MLYPWVTSLIELIKLCSTRLHVSRRQPSTYLSLRSVLVLAWLCLYRFCVGSTLLVFSLLQSDGWCLSMSTLSLTPHLYTVFVTVPSRSLGRKGKQVKGKQGQGAQLVPASLSHPAGEAIPGDALVPTGAEHGTMAAAAGFMVEYDTHSRPIVLSTLVILQFSHSEELSSEMYISMFTYIGYTDTL